MVVGIAAGSGASRAGVPAGVKSRSSAPPRAASKGQQGAFRAQFGFIPATDTVGSDKKPADPFNVIIEGNRQQVVNSLEDAGWVSADHLTLLSGLKMVVAFIFHIHYSHAPVSSQDYQGRQQDLAFEHLGPTVSSRDHVRLWNTGHKAANGQDIWVGAATKDVAVVLQSDLMPTHEISGAVDSERANVVSTMTAAGAQDLGTWQRSGPRQAVNAQGMPYHTDGGVAVLRVGSVSPPVQVKARSFFRRLGAGIASLFF